MALGGYKIMNDEEQTTASAKVPADIFSGAISLTLQCWKIALISAALGFIGQIIIQALGVGQIAQWTFKDWVQGGIWFSISTAIGTYVGMGYWVYMLDMRKGGAPTFGIFIGGANRFFIRGLGGILISSCILFPAAAVPIGTAIAIPMLSASLPKAAIIAISAGGVLLGVFLFIAGFWFSLKISLWTPIMFTDQVGPIEAMKRSYAQTKDNLLTVFLWICLPMAVVNILAKVTVAVPVQLAGEILKFFIVPVFLPAVVLLVYESIRDKRAGTT